jgi:DNA repair exonuclease SbcCD ATPase subunit
MDPEIDRKEEITEIKKLESALDLMNSARSNMNAMFEGMAKIINTTRSTLLSLEDEKKRLEKIKEEQEREISGLTNDQMKLLKEYEQVKEELEKFTKIASGDGEITIDNMKSTLAIYRVLLEEIWQSQPHYRVLYLLHGDAEEMDVEQLKGASGVSGAMILHACHELAKKDLITFDIETKRAKLVRRLFPRRQKK